MASLVCTEVVFLVGMVCFGVCYYSPNMAERVASRVVLELRHPRVVTLFSGDGVGMATLVNDFDSLASEGVGWDEFVRQKLTEGQSLVTSSRDVVEAKARLLGVGFDLTFTDPEEAFRVVMFYLENVRPGIRYFPGVVLEMARPHPAASHEQIVLRMER